NYYDRHRASVRTAAAGDVLVRLAEDLDGRQREQLQALLCEMPDAVTRKRDAELEAMTARRAFVACWLNTVDEAIRLLGAQGRVMLSSSLLPLPSSPSSGSMDHATWNTW